MTAFRRAALPRRGLAPSVAPAARWLNSAPHAPGELRGNVVLYVFWTYTCINWLRVLPYVRAWDAKYRDRDFVVVGVHTPEFAFEREFANVERAVMSQHIEFPVVMDSDYEIWRAFDNHYWPALYLADERGEIRYTHFGEGRYANSELAIQRLLSEAGAADVASDLVEPAARGVEAPADWAHLETAETYLGDARADGSASLSGAWTLQEDRITAAGPGAVFSLPFHARDVHLVMAPMQPARPVPFRVTLDGEAPGDAHGLDIDAAGAGELVEPRMYQLVRQPHAITDRTIEITFPAAGADAFVVTFG